MSRERGWTAGSRAPISTGVPAGWIPERDRQRFAALDPAVDAETFFGWVRGLSLLVGLLSGGAVFWLLSRAAKSAQSVIWSPLAAVADAFSVLSPGSIAFLVAAGSGIGMVGLVRLGVSAGLEYLLRRRRLQIERTLPGAVRYMHVIASGTTDPAALFESVAEEASIHGATAHSLRRILAVAGVTGSVESGIRQVARTTPSKDTLAPFLLSFLERTREGPDAVREFLRLESRLLASADERQHHRETRYLATVIRLFVGLLVLPVVLIVGVGALAVLLPDLLPSVPAVEVPAVTGFLATAGSALILLLGGIAAALAASLRPSGHRWALPSPSQRPTEILKTCHRNPTNALFVAGPVALGLSLWLVWSGAALPDAAVFGYALLAIPVGLVDANRARRRAAIDRRLPDFVHAVGERLDAGIPFREAVTRVARRRTFGPLDPYVAGLVYDLELDVADGTRRRALRRFVGRIGTPLAGRTIGLAVGALDAGADTRSAFAALQTETGRLVHADQARRSRFPVVIAVGWTVAVLIVAIVVAVNAMVLDSAAPMHPGPVSGVVVEATLGAGERRPLFYLVTQAAMLASGWFAGVAGRGAYEGLLHSGALVTVTYLVFRMAGLL